MTDDKFKKLLEQRKIALARIQQEQSKEAAGRKINTRRKILVEACIPEKASKDKKYNDWLINGLGSSLTKPDNHALFGLPTLPATDTVSAPVPTPIDSKEKTE